MDSRVTNPLQNAIDNLRLLIVFKCNTQASRALEQLGVLYTVFLQAAFQQLKVQKHSSSAQSCLLRPSRLTPRVSLLVALRKFFHFVLPAGWLTQDRLTQINQETIPNDFFQRVRNQAISEIVHQIIPCIRKYFECFTAMDSDPIHRGALLIS